MVCLKHPDRNTTTVCAACGKPLCDECAMDFNGRIYCSDECRQKGEASRIRAVDVIETSGKVDRRSALRKFIWFVIVLLLMAGIWYFYTQNRKTVDAKFKKGMSSLKETKDEVINAGKGAMPQDTKYKREREALVE